MPTLIEEIRQLTGIDLSSCGSCAECTAPSAMKGALDLSTNEIVRLIREENREKLFASRAIWLLSGCRARRIVCEHGVNLGEVLSAIRTLALESGASPAEPDVAAMMQSFRRQIEKRGRAHHWASIREMRKRLEDPATEGTQEAALLLRRKLRLRPERVREIGEVRRLLTPGERP